MQKHSVVVCSAVPAGVVEVHGSTACLFIPGSRQPRGTCSLLTSVTFQPRVVFRIRSAPTLPRRRRLSLPVPSVHLLHRGRHEPTSGRTGAESPRHVLRVGNPRRGTCRSAHCRGGHKTCGAQPGQPRSHRGVVVESQSWNDSVTSPSVYRQHRGYKLRPEMRRQYVRIEAFIFFGLV